MYQITIKVPELILVLHPYCIAVCHPFYSLAQQCRCPHTKAVANNVKVCTHRVH